MSLTACPNCTGRISTRALECPHCAHPLVHEPARMGRCRSCKAVLDFDTYRPRQRESRMIDGYSRWYEYYQNRPCRSCGDPEPLKPFWGNHPEMWQQAFFVGGGTILFVVVVSLLVHWLGG